MGIARHQEEIDSLIMKGRKWIDAEQERRHPRLDLFGEERDVFVHNQHLHQRGGPDT